MKRKWSLFTFIALFALLLAACGGPADEAAAPDDDAADTTADTTEETAASEEEAMEVQDFVTWYQYDEKNEDPASDERVGNEYLRTTIPQFNEAFDGTWHWVNQPKAFDRMAAELVTAVQAGGEVPDLYEMNSDQINTFYRNGTLQDLSDWAEGQDWYSDLDASAVAACTGPDGGLYCIPISQRPQVVYVWADHFPNGYPTTPEEFMVEADRLKAEGNYVMTFFGSTDKGGLGIERAVFTTMTSFGGGLDDGNGNLLLNTPENIAAVEFLRNLVVNDYVPEIVFAGGFQEEQAFKDNSAGSFPSGLNGYRYINPLIAPDGTEYGKGSDEDILDAIAAGDVYIAPYFAVEGQRPGCDTKVAGFAIPVGANNAEAAHDYINWIMDAEQNADWVIGPGGGFPVLGATRSDEMFAADFFQQAGEAVAASSCRPWYGSLERPEEAKPLVMAAIYKLIKEDPTADIAEVLTEVQDEYNAGN